MHSRFNLFVHSLYEGTPGDKLAAARDLLARLASPLAASPDLTEALALLRQHVQDLDEHMRRMALGRLCSQCAARPGGGCCSALMADNTDAVQILINLLLGTAVDQQATSSEECCFLGPQGCCFPAKPIFCLNYNCSHILAGADPAHLAVLLQRAAAVLSQQTAIEDMILALLRRHADEFFAPRTG